MFDIKNKRYFIILTLLITFIFSSTVFAVNVDALQRAETKVKSSISYPDFSQLVKRLTPYTVNINTTHIIKPKDKDYPFKHYFKDDKDPLRDFFGDDFFDRFFGDLPQREFKQRSLGSGFIIDKEGYILTNYHVIEKADEIRVTTSEGEDYDASVIGSDGKTDIALIKIENGGKGFPYATLGDSDALSIGEWIIAIGNPFGLGETVTAGIVSAKGRIIGTGPYDDFIQTDASINPGNSGGPLFNLKGEVVGINTAIIMNANNIGFAVPINMAKSIIAQLKESGHVTRGWLGVYIQKITKELAESFGLEEVKGALISDVFKDSPAKEAGLQRGDIITYFNGIEIKEMNELPKLVASTPVDKEVEVKVLRKGEEKTFTIKIAKMKEDSKRAKSEVKDLKEKFGMSVQEITPDLAKHFDLEKEEGVIVTDVEPTGPASDAEIKRGDIILEANQKQIKTIDDLKSILGKAKKGDNILLLIKRSDTTYYAAIKSGK
jgi:serine protease Do